jgi:hypothetical protein
MLVQIKDPLAPTRQARLQEYCRGKGWEFPGGRWNTSAVALAIGKSVTKASNLLNGTGPFGAKIARDIEDTLRVPGGTLDGMIDENGWPFPGINRERFDRLFPEQKLEIQGMVRRAITDFEMINQNDKAA